MDEIPFNRPAVLGSELEMIGQALAGPKLSGDGPFTARCHALLEQRLHAKKVLLTTSCTDALEMAALLLDVGPGDEVVVPSFTFVSTVNAFVLRGATPVFIDVRPDTLNLDERQLEARLTSRTKAIVPVHYAGVGCAMDEIMRIADARGVSVVEDNAQGLFAKYRGRMLGSFGAMSTVSFHETKNFTCGEGGALVVNDAAYVPRAEILREKGTNRSRFFRGEVDKYTWVDVGSSFLPSDMLAAFLFAQLSREAEITEARRAVWTRYADELAPWAARTGARLPIVPPECEQPYHMFYVVLPDAAATRAFSLHMRERKIMAPHHYVPLHLSTMGMRFGGAPGQLPVTEDVSARLLRLPLFGSLTVTEQDRVIDAVTAFQF